MEQFTLFMQRMSGIQLTGRLTRKVLGVADFNGIKNVVTRIKIKQGSNLPTIRGYPVD